MYSNCYITIYEHFSAIKGVKLCLTPRYDHLIVVYYPRNNKQLSLPPTIYNLCYIIQHNLNYFIKYKARLYVKSDL